MLQCVAVRCKHMSRALSQRHCCKDTVTKTLQHTATNCNNYNTLQHTTTRMLACPLVPTPPPSTHATHISFWIAREKEYTSVQVLQHTDTAKYGDTLHHTATHCPMLRSTATHCNTLQHTVTHCDTLQHTATHCNILQHTTPHSSTLQYTASHCNTL